MTQESDRFSNGGRPALMAWMAALAAAVGLLHALAGALAPPPLTDPGGWGRWLEARQPAEAAFAVVRLVALGLALYLLAATAAATVVRLSGAPALVRAADAVTVPLVRRLANGAVGASFVAVTLAGAGAAGAAGRADPPAAVETMRRLPDAAGAAGDEAAPVMHRLPDAAAPAGRAGAGIDPAPTNPPAPADRAGAGARTWTVRPGDHFWAVAEQVLAESLQRPATDREVDPYWRAVVEANRSVLRDPANPDLLFPGQVIAIPPPPAG